MSGEDKKFMPTPGHRDLTLCAGRMEFSADGVLFLPVNPLNGNVRNNRRD
jgi:hypothetical protein